MNKLNFLKLLIIIISVFGLNASTFAVTGPIIGPSSVCVGSFTVLSDSTTGGSWSSSNTAVAIIGSSSRVVSGMSAGTTTITYSGPGIFATKLITINPIPAPISGPTNVCVYSAATYTDATVGGIWSSSDTMVAKIDPATGNDTFLTAGAAMIIYTLPTGCLTTVTVIANAVPNAETVTVTGSGVYCVGSPGVHIGLSGSTSGCTYQLYLAGIAVGSPLVGSGSSLDFGLITAAGIYTVKATQVSTGCVNQMANAVTVAINPLPPLDTVTGGGGYCFGGSGTHIGVTFGHLGYDYNLYDGSGPVGSPISGANAPLDFGLQTSPGVYTVVCSDPATTCVRTMAGSTTISIAPLPVAYVLMGHGGGYCAGGAGDTVTLNNSDAGVSYQLYRSASPVGSPYTGTGGILNFGPQATAGVYTVWATNVATGCRAKMVGYDSVYVNPLPPLDTVTGGGSYCAGGTGVNVGLSYSHTGINYQLFIGASPVSAPVPGINSVLNFGLQTTAGTYAAIAINPVTGCVRNMLYSVSVSVTPVVVPSVSMTASPGDTVCPGTTVTFSPSSVNGGTSPTYTWKLNGIFAATGSSYSLVPVNGDVVALTMTSSAACATPSSATTGHNMIVNLMPAITGSTSVCIGATSSLTDASPGGTWTSSDPSVATVATIGGSVGVSTGVASGTTTLTYLLSTGCYAVTTLTVLPSPTITASYSSACGDLYTLTSTGGVSYSWSPTTGLSCPTCGVTTVSPSTTTVYSVTGTDAAGCTNTNYLSVNGNRIFGHITFASTIPDTLDMQVWLIQYDPTDSSIVALDSTTTCVADSMGYYEFDSKPAGTYMVKAKLLYGNTPGSSGYLPTYSYNSPYWYGASTVTHVSSSDSLPIVMAYGTVPSGPGFIGGYVYAGAGKGTSGEAPVEGMMIFLKDLASNSLTYTYTDVTGAYSFRNLGYGDYIIYPEQFDYNTIASNFITLSASSESITDVTFKQYTTSRIIKPFTKDVSVKTIATTTDINVYPNPSNGALNIQWKEQKTGTASVIISDMMGRTAYNSTFSVNAASGNTTLDLNGLNDGIYMISVTSGTINYSAKLLLQK